MPIQAKVILDSKAESTGVRLTTLELTFPRSILAEFNTHRMISKNSASSRAIPMDRLIRRVKEDTYIPVFRRNKKGMQAGEELTGFRKWLAIRCWLFARDCAILMVKIFSRIGVHKQYANRLIEPWMHVVILATATDWDNMIFLRDTEAAEPSFRELARCIVKAMNESEPVERLLHLPYVTEEEFAKTTSTDTLVSYSAARCARVSYLNHDGELDQKKDLALAKTLSSSGHWSPFEHVAVAAPDLSGSYNILSLKVATGFKITPKDRNQQGYHGNLRGWIQYRKFYQNENATSCEQLVKK